LAPLSAGEPPAPEPLPASQRESDSPTATDLDPATSAERRITDNTVTAGDVATTPVDDFNLRDRKYPGLLLDLQKDPYSSSGLDGCEAIADAIAPLDDLLGDDLDIAPASKRQITAGALGREAVGLLIPFRGLIREASGANASKRRLADLVIVGMMRRSYLKGLGEQRGCSYPARPADEETKAVLAALAPTAPPAAAKAKKERRDRTSPEPQQ
jgi:hypothetical protein